MTNREIGEERIRVVEAWAKVARDKTSALDELRGAVLNLLEATDPEEQRQWASECRRLVNG